MRLTVDPITPGKKVLDWWSRFGLENDETWKRALIVMLLLSIAVPFIAPLNHDAAWHLYAAKRMLEGEQLYVDLIEYNPPFIYFFNLPIVGLAQLLGLSEGIVFRILILALAMGLLWLSYRLLLIASQQIGRSVPRLLLLTFLCFSIPYIGIEFGQREQLMLLFIFPYLLLLAGRIQKQEIPAWMTLAAGMCGAIGLAFKPQFLLVWGLLEAYAWLWRGIQAPWRRQESLSVTSFFAVYGLGVLLFMPEYVAVIETAAETYPAFDPSIWETLAFSARYPLIALAVLLILQSNSKNRTLCHLLALATVGSLAVAIAAQKGWFYHFIPANAFSTLLLTFIVVTLVEGKADLAPRPRPFQAFTSIIVLVTLLTMIGYQLKTLSLRRGVWEYSDEGRLVELIEAEGPDQRLMFFSTSMYPAFPVVNHTGSRWTLRFPFLWFIPGLYPHGYSPRVQAGSMSETERTFFRQIVDDFLQENPTFVVSDDLIRKQGLKDSPFDFLTYFQQDPRFAQRWKDYELVTIAGGYRVFKRDGSKGGQTAGISERQQPSVRQ